MASNLPNAQPFYVRERQPWAVSQERQRHDQALLSVGEMVMFTLMWKVEDFEAGLVDRCTRCAGGSAFEQAAMTIYEQPLTYRCPVCYGTTFGTGIRAQIIRPAILTDADEDERKAPRGATHQESLSVTSTEDFRSRTGDWMFRANGTRWQLGHPQRTQVRTGFQQPSQLADSMGYAQIPAAREDLSSVAFIIPPTDKADVATALAVPVHFPSNPSGTDIINGPLIPVGAEGIEIVTRNS